MKDTAGYGREISTRSFLGRARVRDNLDIGYRASIIFGTSEVVLGWCSLRLEWSTSFSFIYEWIYQDLRTAATFYQQLWVERIRQVELCQQSEPIGPKGLGEHDKKQRQGQPGYIPGFTIGIWILGYNVCCSLLLGTSPTSAVLLLLGVLLGI